MTTARPALGEVLSISGSFENPEKLLLLFVLAFGLAAVLYGTKCLAMLAIGFVQHRRACNIDATLETKGHRFDGRLCIIGLNGCRFQHVRRSSEQRFRTLLGSPVFNDFDVHICGVSYPVFVDGFHIYYSPLYFFDQLSRAKLKEILKISKIEPYLVPRIGHASTRQKWKEDIARRTKIIAAQKSQVNSPKGRET